MLNVKLSSSISLSGNFRGRIIQFRLRFLITRAVCTLRPHLLLLVSTMEWTLTSQIRHPWKQCVIWITLRASPCNSSLSKCPRPNKCIKGDSIKWVQILNIEQKHEKMAGDEFYINTFAKTVPLSTFEQPYSSHNH